MALFLSVLLWATMFCLNWYTLVLAPFRESVKYPILASMVATLVLEAPGPQEWTWDKDAAVKRLVDAYGAEAGDEISQAL